MQKRKQDALEEQFEAGDDSEKTSVHLEPNRKRVGSGAGDSSPEKLNDALVGIVMAQQQISVANAANYALEEKNADQARLEKYMEYLLNPHIPAELQANYQRMVATLQAKIFADDSTFLECARALDGGGSLSDTLTVAEVGAELARIELPRYVATFAE